MKIMQGDCLRLLPTIPDRSVSAVITDPPYGMSFQSNRVSADRKKAKIAGDEKPFIWFLPEAFRVLEDDSALICFTDWKNQETWRIAIECAGFTIRSHCVWDRGIHGMGDLKASFAPQHDVFWFATKGSFSFPGKRPKSIIKDMRPSRDATPHPTAKPINLMRELCRSTCRPGGVILDPFLGSGSTGEAAVREGFGFIGMEMDENYVQFSTQRISSAVSELSTDMGIFG